VSLPRGVVTRRKSTYHCGFRGRAAWFAAARPGGAQTVQREQTGGKTQHRCDTRHRRRQTRDMWRTHQILRPGLCSPRDLTACGQHRCAQRVDAAFLGGASAALPRSAAVRCIAMSMSAGLPIVSPLLTALASVSHATDLSALRLDANSSGTQGSTVRPPPDPKASPARSQCDDPENYPFVVIDEPFSAALRASATLGGPAAYSAGRCALACDLTDMVAWCWPFCVRLHHKPRADVFCGSAPGLRDSADQIAMQAARIHVRVASPER